MLVLKRKAGESIIVADNIEIKIIEVEEGRIKIGIDAPKEVRQTAVAEKEPRRKR